MKGAGVPGTEITAEQIDHMQQVVDSLNEHFLAGVASGRKLDSGRVRELADGRVHIASRAQELGLVDSIGTLDAALAELCQKSISQRRPSAMSETTTHNNSAPEQVTNQAASTVVTPPAATIKQLRAACPGADAEFLAKQLDAEATVASAQTAWMTEQANRLAATQAELASAKAAANKPGVPALGAGLTGTSTAGSSTAGVGRDAFNAAVEARMREANEPRHIAARWVCKNQPEAVSALNSVAFVKE
jgi:ClpP class serine protease